MRAYQHVVVPLTGNAPKQMAYLQNELLLAELFLGCFIQQTLGGAMGIILRYAKALQCPYG
jgi:hypothetical protein